MSLPVRVLVVDDSVTMRGIISGVLRRDPDIEVVGTAGDPYEARELIKALNPDVLTLDIEMPKMDGIEFLKKIMKLRPMPVVMISTLTHKGADLAIRALSSGAFDCLGKPADGNVAEAFARLPSIIEAASKARLRQTPTLERSAVDSSPLDFTPNGKIIAVGSSTGGVEALVTLLSGFPKNCPPTVLVQHMPELFTASFAARLNKLCAPKVEEARDGAELHQGCIYLAPGAVSHLTIERERQFVCRLTKTDKVSGHRPSVNVLFNSVAEVARRRAVGVILTGMGSDGAKGLLEMREAGCATFGQDKKTSVIYGMPRAAFELGAVGKQLPLHKIARAVLGECNKNQKDERAA